jgi:hypothetical protein
VVSPVPTCGTYVLRFKNAAGAPSTTNKADYKFQLDQTEEFVNNAGAAFAVTGPKPTVKVSVIDGSLSEVPTSDTGKIRFIRTGCTQLSLPVKYVAQGTATNGVDYDMVSGTATIGVGFANQTTTIRPLDDAVAEGDETVTLKVSPNANYIVGDPNLGTATLHSNE